MNKSVVFFLLALILAAVNPAEAQQTNKAPRIGFLGNSTAALEANLVGPFRDGLRDLGYVESQNIMIEYRWAEGKYERFPALIAELIASKVDVVVTAGTPATQAYQRARTSIPLVMVAVGDPVGTGIVASLSRPGGNITGLTSISPELESKRIELLREVIPKLSHIAVLWNPKNAFHPIENRQVESAAAALRMKVLSLGVEVQEQIGNAFAQILKERPGALLVLADRVFLHNRALIMDFAAKHRLPGVYAYLELVEAGGLMSYGPSYSDMHRRAATYVDKILKGAKPADLPVEQPTKFELVINLKTAKAIGIKIPESLLLRAESGDRMKTIKKILVTMLLAIALPCWAQAPPRIAWIWPGSVEGNAIIVSAFKDGMRENGLMEGKDYVLDERYAEGKYDRFYTLADELLKRNPSIIMVNTIASVRAAQKATRTVPIVFVYTNDPVGSGLVASLARPGGNTTGLSTQFEDVVEKYIELLRELLPRASRIAVLVNPGNPSGPKMFERVFASAGAFGITARAFEVTSPGGLDSVFGAIAKHRPDALLVIPEATFFDQRNRIAALAIGQRLPAIVPQSEYVASGCLISFGTNRPEVFRRSAIYVKKILAGARPADLPVEQPTKFELVVNMKTAKALGITIPQSVLLRADEVIQ